MESLNQGSVPNYTELTPLNIQIFPAVSLITLGAVDPSVSRSVISASSFVVTNVGSLPVTLQVQASTIPDSSTAGMPQRILLTLTPVFQ